HPLLYFKGYQAVQAYRLGHYLWQQGRKDMAYFLQMRISETFGVDIHPAARIGRGIMIDHAHSIVIGETAVVGDNVLNDVPCCKTVAGVPAKIVGEAGCDQPSVSMDQLLKKCMGEG
ncbi:MAG: serine O-acetyltransferase, partial [Marivivens sp.]|nr:serine O-acetyltransferase [Marivivens sp.]